MTDLAARLEAATEGSRELSDAVLLACGWKFKSGGLWISGWLPKVWYPPWGPHFQDGQQPSPTERVEDAFILKPEGYTARDLVLPEHKKGFRFAFIILPLSDRDDDGERPVGRGATVALAFSAAIVRARA